MCTYGRKSSVSGNFLQVNRLLCGTYDAMTLGSRYLRNLLPTDGGFHLWLYTPFVWKVSRDVRGHRYVVVRPLNGRRRSRPQSFPIVMAVDTRASDSFQYCVQYLLGRADPLEWQCSISFCKRDDFFMRAKNTTSRTMFKTPSASHFGEKLFRRKKSCFRLRVVSWKNLHCFKRREAE